LAEAGLAERIKVMGLKAEGISHKRHKRHNEYGTHELLAWPLLRIRCIRKPRGEGGRVGEGEKS